MRRRRRFSGDDGPQMSGALSIDRVAGVAASLLMLGSQTTRPVSAPAVSKQQQQPALNDVPFLSRQATIGRNSQFHNLTTQDRELLGGIEYRSLKLLLKIVTGKSSRLNKKWHVEMLIITKLTSLESISSVASVSWAGFTRPTPSIPMSWQQAPRTRPGGM